MSRQERIDALQTALAAEHAALWAYGLIGAFLSEAVADQLAEAVAEHHRHRDAAERALVDAGEEPVTAEPGYLTPEPVSDVGSALRLAITVEIDTAAAWRSVIERSPAQPGPRMAALGAVTDAAVRAARWRAVADLTPLTVPFPGAP